MHQAPHTMCLPPPCLSSCAAPQPLPLLATPATSATSPCLLGAASAIATATACQQTPPAAVLLHLGEPVGLEGAAPQVGDTASTSRLLRSFAFRIRLEMSEGFGCRVTLAGSPCLSEVEAWNETRNPPRLHHVSNKCQHSTVAHPRTLGLLPCMLISWHDQSKCMQLHAASLQCPHKRAEPTHCVRATLQHGELVTHHPARAACFPYCLLCRPVLLSVWLVWHINCTLWKRLPAKLGRLYRRWRCCRGTAQDEPQGPIRPGLQHHPGADRGWWPYRRGDPGGCHKHHGPQQVWYA